MDFKLRYFKFLIDLIILCSLFPKISPVLSFTYPQSTTLNNKNILVVEKEGIHICDPSFTSKIRTVYSFPDEDKITTSSSLSKTFIKKSSYAILILSNYKLYFIDYNNGALLKNTSKVITEEEPEYVDLAYSYDYVNTLFYFTVSYISQSNNLIVKFYQYVKSSNTVHPHNSYSLSSVNRESITFTFQKKGLSCDSIVDSRSNTYYGGYNYGFYSCFVCFIIANDGTDDYLIPISFEEGEDSISFLDDYSMGKIKVNNNIQIKSDTNDDMKTAYVCYVTVENVGTCRDFYLDMHYEKGSFSDNIKTFTKNCRSDLYGMKVTYIFESDDVLFTCSDLDGSIQVKMLNQNQGHYFKYQNCNNIYGYSIIYLADSENYYVTSDVTCPEGKIPYVILIEPSDYIPEVVAIDTTNKESLIESSSISSTMAKEKIIETTYQEKIDIQTTNKLTEKITEKIPEEIQQSTIAREKISTIINVESPKTTQVINIDTIRNSKEVNECPEKCLQCNSKKECIECNKNKHYYPIELTSISPDSPESKSSQTVAECITEEIKEIKHPNFYLDSESESFKPCYENCATCFGKGDGNNNNCITCEPGYILHPEYENSKDCVPKPNSLYYMKYAQYTITNSDRCPEDFSFLIKEKSKCIEDCKLDNKYNYTYDGLCYEQPPENTNDDDGDHKCKDNPNTCVATRKELNTLNDTITDLEIELLILKYAQEYDYTNYHITSYENDIYIITIYKNG